MQVIKDKAIIDDGWALLRELADEDDLPKPQSIMPFNYWQGKRSALIATKAEYGVWIDGAVEVTALAEDLGYFTIIAIDFPTFKDGRGYSQARLLRERYHYQGDIRAIGDVLRDQLFFMQRCGFSSYHIRSDKDINAALAGLTGFSVSYQAAADEMLPVYKRRFK